LHIAFFSNQFADRQRYGIARYAHQLFEALRLLRPTLKLTPIAAWSSHDAAGIRELKEKSGLYLLPWGRRGTSFAWTFLDGPPIEYWIGNDIDVVHAVSLGYPVSTRKPYVVTVHDIGPLTHPEFFTNTRPWVMKRSLQQALRKAAAIICVSKSTADELESYVGQSLKERLHVVHEGVSPEFFRDMNPDGLAEVSGLPELGIPFILATGKISPRKNVWRIIQALSKLRDMIPHHLVLAGGSGWNMEEVLKEMNTSPVAGRVHLIGYVSDEQLHALYSSASVYVHPSLFEGFGLTILEAMASGCPVVTSNVSSLPEVAGDAALLVDPYDVDDIAEAIKSLCSDSSLATDFAKRGRARAKAFTWERCAEQVACIYQNVIERK
jgi:glycosyltransferase involved in cell wall biosynthesis